jgi:hypothetical protein
MVGIVKINGSKGFALAVAVAVGAACSGNQADVTYGADGAIVTDSGISTPGPDASSHVDSGVGLPDSTMSTFVDSGLTNNPDTGTTTVVDSGGTVEPDGAAGEGGVCPSTCSADSDCQSACPAVAGAVNCCDTVTSACFSAASATCPDQTTTSTGSDGGGAY